MSDEDDVIITGQTEHLECPHCHQSGKLYVINSRADPRDNSVRRRRKCSACGQRVTTRELVRLSSTPSPIADESLRCRTLAIRLRQEADELDSIARVLERHAKRQADIMDEAGA